MPYRARREMSTPGYRLVEIEEGKEFQRQRVEAIARTMESLSGYGAPRARPKALAHPTAVARIDEEGLHIFRH